MDDKLLQLLRCPISKGELLYDEARQELVSVQAGVAYPIRDGIPVLLAEEGRKLDEDECRRHGAARSGDDS